MINSDYKIEDIEKLAIPLVEYLRKFFHPHCTITITDERIFITEDVLSIPNKLQD